MSAAMPAQVCSLKLVSGMGHWQPGNGRGSYARTAMTTRFCSVSVSSQSDIAYPTTHVCSLGRIERLPVIFASLQLLMAPSLMHKLRRTSQLMFFASIGDVKRCSILVQTAQQLYGTEVRILLQY